MDPYGRYESSHYDKQHSRHYYDHITPRHTSGAPIPRYYSVEGGFPVDKRSCRRLRFWIGLVLLVNGIGFLAYWKFYGLDATVRTNEVVFETITGEIIGSKQAIGPEMVVPPDVSMKPSTNPKDPQHENDKPPILTKMETTIDEVDHLNSPLVKLPASKAAEKMADQLLAATKAVASEERQPQQASLSNQAVELETLLGVKDNSLSRFTDQVEELTRRLSMQLQLIDTLQNKLEQQSTVVDRGANSHDQEIAKNSEQVHRNADMSKNGPNNPSSCNNKGRSLYQSIAFHHPPVSTIVCTGSNTVDRVCKFKNLCYDPSRDNFFIFKDVHTLEVNVPKNRSYLVDTTSIDGHNKFFFDYNEVHPNLFVNKTVKLVEKLTFMVSRFHALNIMHTIHDDFLGLYGLHRMFASNDDISEKFSFGRNNNLFFLDSFENLRYDYIFQFLTDNPLQFRTKLHKEHAGKPSNPICFRNVVVGNSKIGSWYNYGFLEPQGPIANKTTSGLYVRDAARFLMDRMDMPGWDEDIVRTTIQELFLRKLSYEKTGKRVKGFALRDHTFITIFSRQLDRLIVNEGEIINALKETFGLPVKTVRMEDMHLSQQVAILRSTAIAVGAHGSALILSMFLPPGAILIELFPYAVPAENYTPYKTLCNLPGMRLTYRFWTNKKPENNFPHPERAPSGGGIKHLPPADQEKIKNTLTVPSHLCCSDPYWLYRIYQDTKIEIPELVAVIEDAFRDSLNMLDMDPQSVISIRPGVVDKIQCIVKVPSGIDLNLATNATKLDLEVQWEGPWNGITPDRYGVWVHQPYTEYFTTKSSISFHGCIYGSKYDIWIRSYLSTPGSPDLIRSQYSGKHTCYCKPDSSTRKTELTDL